MSTRRNTITFLIIIGLVMFLAWRETPTPVYSTRQPKVTCQEDMACWNCQTMGNSICGKP